MPVLTFRTIDGGLTPVASTDIPKLRCFAENTSTGKKPSSLSLKSAAQPTPQQLAAIIDLVRNRPDEISWLEQLLFNRREVKIKLTGECIAAGILFDLRYIPGAGWFHGEDTTTPHQTIDDAENAGNFVEHEM